MSAPSTSGLSVIKSYCYELSTLNKVYFTLLYFTLHTIPALDTTLDQRCLPMGYAFPGNEPDPLIACDLTACPVQDHFLHYVRLNCGHSVHEQTCLQRVCPVCHPLLQRKIEQLSTTMNR